MENELVDIINKLINNNDLDNSEEIKIDDIETRLERLQIIKEKINNLIPEIFEKDNDENNHVNFILSLSNLRAENYKISKCNFLKAKEIAGNIIPAIVSTTAAITGIVCLQIYTILQTNSIKFMKSSAINLGNSEYDVFSPEGKRYIIDQEKTSNSKAIKVIPEKYSVWDSFIIKGPKVTIEEIIKYFKLKYNIEIDYINSGKTTLSSPFEDEEDITSTIEELYAKEKGIEINKNLKYIELNLVSINKYYKYSIPIVKYCLKPIDNKLIKNDEKIMFKKINDDITCL